MGSPEEKESTWGFRSWGVGCPREDSLIEEDVGGSGDASGIAQEYVKGVWSIMRSTEMDGGEASGRVIRLFDVVVADDGYGSAAKGEYGEKVWDAPRDPGEGW